ncbi:MAG: hypothetical protein MJE66_14855 [Proteobacteria bacterium]|nr:hypothetical protein [Pseudomonadota bacterium]
MAPERGKRGGPQPAHAASANSPEDSPLDRGAEPKAPPGPLPELIRRLAALGLSGFFTTETALRRALGDTVPQEWVDFAAGQSERTRSEVIERMAAEFGRVFEQVDLAAVLSELLEGHTLDVRAQIRLEPRADDESGAEGGIRFSVAGTKKDTS